MKRKLNDANTNKVGNAKEEEKNATPDVAFGYNAGVALIEAFNKTIDDRGSITVGDILVGLGGGVSAFIWRLMKDEEPSVRYHAIMSVGRKLIQGAHEEIFENEEDY